MKITDGFWCKSRDENTPYCRHFGHMQSGGGWTDAYIYCKFLHKPVYVLPINAGAFNPITDVMLPEECPMKNKTEDKQQPRQVSLF